MLDINLDAIADTVGTLLDKWVPDADERNRLAHEIATLSSRQAHEANLAQVSVTKTEAAHNSVFVAGWRPWLGWVCGTGVAFNYVALPVIKTSAALYGVDAEAMSYLEPFDMSVMLPLLGGMLGLGGYRTFEKVKGVARNSLK